MNAKTVFKLSNVSNLKSLKLSNFSNIEEVKFCLLRMTRVNQPWFNPVAATAWHMLIGGIPLMIFSLIDSGFALPSWTSMDWLRMSFASLLGSALAYGLFFWFANRRDLTSFSSLGFLTPVFALATGGLLLGEKLDPLQWCGVLMVLGSVFCVSQRRRFWEQKEELFV